MCPDRDQMKVEHRQIVERVRPFRRVLVVDDRASFRSCVAGFWVQELGRRRRSGPTASQTIALAAELRPELVLLDVSYPTSTASQFAARLGEAEAGAPDMLVSGRDRSSYGPLIDPSGARGSSPRRNWMGRRSRGSRVDGAMLSRAVRTTRRGGSRGAADAACRGRHGRSRLCHRRQQERTSAVGQRC